MPMPWSVKVLWLAQALLWLRVVAGDSEDSSDGFAAASTVLRPRDHQQSAILIPGECRAGDSWCFTGSASLDQEAEPPPEDDDFGGDDDFDRQVEQEQEELASFARNFQGGAHPIPTLQSTSTNYDQQGFTPVLIGNDDPQPQSPPTGRLGSPKTPVYPYTSSPTLFSEITKAATVYDLGTLYMARPKEFYERHMSLLLQEVVRRGANFNAPEAVNLKAAVTDIVTQIRRFAGQMDINKLSRMISCLSTLQMNATAVYMSVAHEVIRRHQSMHCQALSDVAWSFAAMNVRAPELYVLLAKQALARLDQLNPRGLVNMLWALAQMKIFHPDLLRAGAPKLSQWAYALYPKDLARIVWSYTEARVNGVNVVPYVVGLFDTMAGEIALRLDKFTPEHITQVLWGFISFNIYKEGLYDDIAHAVLNRPATAFKAADLAGLAVSLTSIPQAWYKEPGISEKALTSVAQKAKLRLHQFKTSDLANMAWSYTGGKEEGDKSLRDELMLAIAEVSVGKLQLFPTGSLTLLMRSYAKLQMSPVGLADAAAQAVTKQIARFSYLEIADISRSLATIHSSDDNGTGFHDLGVRLAEVLKTAHFKRFTVRDLAIIAWSFGTAGVHPPNLLELISFLVQQRKSELSMYEVETLVAAYSTLRVYPPGLFEVLGEKMLLAIDESKVMKNLGEAQALVQAAQQIAQGMFT